MSISAALPRTLARFELLRVLGRGAQATVWLAHDPRLDREVAVKLLNPETDALSVSQWLQEARAVSRLTHPNIVPVFEADEADGQPYLVFEYVAGPTLAEARRQRPALPAREAVTLLLGVLDALAAAHAQGLVHRDLKPSNILLGQDGRARVMDFGIAARVAGGRGALATDGRIVGTAGYMSPEAARGEPPAPAMDVFAAGVLLGELLSGAPLLRESDPHRALLRVQNEDLALPAGVKVDDTLRGIVQRALARDSRARYDGARAMHAALSAWLNPDAMAAPEIAASHGTLEFLLRRMRHKTDFPALSESVLRIQRVATSETESLASLSGEILKDVALTNKLLRMVNTARFTSAAGGGVSTVTRAVALVGFAGIRNMALSVLLLEHMGDRAHATQLKEEFLRALMAGTLASELTSLAKESEEAFLGSMFQNLGRLLTEFYFPEEALQIRQQLAPDETTPGAREAAAVRVLGIGFEDLGVGIARAWGLPDGLQRAMRAPEGEAPARAAAPGVERLRWLGRSANALTDAMLANEGAAQQQALAAVASLYAPTLGLPASEIVAAAQSARTQLAQLTLAMGLQVAAGTPARRLLDSATLTAAGAAGAKAPALPAVATLAAAARLQSGLDKLNRALSGGQLRLNEVLQQVLETMHGALDFRCVVLCLRDPQSGHITGRFGLGPAAKQVSAAFHIAPASGGNGDLFAALCCKGADTLISDAASAPVASRLPAWYRQAVNAPTFLLLPMMLKGAPFGLIYADKAVAGAIVLGAQDLLLLRALRDQAVAAFKRGGEK